MTIGTAASLQRAMIAEQLAAFNARSAAPANAQAICVTRLAEDGSLAAGLYATMVYDWLAIELLFVSEDLRGSGVGSQILGEAERRARDHNCLGAWLDTFSFQARGFYEKLGYSIVGTIPDHPKGGARHFMMKRFTESD